MDIWNRLAQINIKNKKRFQNLFSEIVSEFQAGKFNLTIGEIENTDYFTVIEDNRMDSYFIHIVPKEIYGLFKEMQKIPNSFLGFSVLAGSHNNKDVRVSCFGVQCSLLGKALIKD